MDAVFVAIEQSSISLWMREDTYAYFVALIFHAIGMALMVGGGIAVALGWLRRTEAVDASTLRGFRPVIAVGAVMAIASGLLLLAAYPAKALTNPIFALKFAFLGVAFWLLCRVRSSVAAVALIIALLGVIAAGKLLLHTATVLTIS